MFFPIQPRSGLFFNRLDKKLKGGIPVKLKRADFHGMQAASEQACRIGGSERRDGQIHSK